MAAKQRDVRMLELTSSEVKSLDKNTKFYQGVGKMLVLPFWGLSAYRADCLIQVCVQSKGGCGKATVVGDRGTQIGHLESDQEAPLPGDDAKE